MRCAAVCSAARVASGSVAQARCISSAVISSAATDDASTPVEFGRVFEQCRVAARPHVGDDPRDGRVDRGILRGLEGRERRELAVEARRRGVEAAQRASLSAPWRARLPRGAALDPARSWRRAPLATAFAIASSSGCTRSRFSLSAAGLTMSRALIGRMSSTTTRSFACSVRPELTRSTIASARPASGASSIEPYSLIRSTCMPFAAKCSRAVCTYLVATRMRAPRWTVPAQSKPRFVATTIRQRAISRSSGW